MDEIQRVCILSAMVEVVSEHGRQSTTVARVIARAGVGRRTFYDLFDGCSGCIDEVFEDGVARALQRMRAACDPRATWAHRVRAALRALLELIDEEPKLARVCFEHALGSPSAINGLRETFDHFAQVIDEGQAATRAARNPPRLAAHVVIGGVLVLVYERLITRDPRPLLELLNPVMSIIVLPYLGTGEAERELKRPTPMRVREPTRPTRPCDRLPDPKLRLTYRTLAVLEAVGAEPGLSNCEVADLAGIVDQGQTSKLLSRLAGLGLVENTGAGQPRGKANAWRLTREGRAICMSSGAGVAADLGAAGPPSG